MRPLCVSTWPHPHQKAPSPPGLSSCEPCEVRSKDGGGGGGDGGGAEGRGGVAARADGAQHVVVSAAEEVGRDAGAEGAVQRAARRAGEPAGGVPRHQALPPFPRRAARRRRPLPPLRPGYSNNSAGKAKRKRHMIQRKEYEWRVVARVVSCGDLEEWRRIQYVHQTDHEFHEFDNTQGTVAWVFALTLIGLIPLAERVSFLTEQLAFYTGPTVGGLLNATCGNATELIIALFALKGRKIEVVKCSLLGSVLSNLLLVLGTSLFCGGLANLGSVQPYDRTQSDVSTGLLILGVLCQSLPMMLRYAVSAGEHSVAVGSAGLELSRACSIVMLLAYVAYLSFQLKTHRQLFEPQEVEDDGDDSVTEEAVLGFSSALFWLAAMTVVIAVLSEYVVGTIEAASHSWGLSVSFISVILLPIVGNAAEHAGAIIFALKNKLDITMGVALGSATQISMFVVPLSVLVGWIMGVQMDLDFKLIETGSLFIAILVTSFTLQDGASHYLKGILLLLCYVVIGACFFVTRKPSNRGNNGVQLAGPTNTWSVQVA